MVVKMLLLFESHDLTFKEQGWLLGSDGFRLSD